MILLIIAIILIIFSGVLFFLTFKLFKRAEMVCSDARMHYNKAKKHLDDANHIFDIIKQTI